ncbi:cell wall anchor protein [Dactylosporangium sp. CA-139114]|uniref:cell wall anchor protein n=1 Tax=Dactylosporangium sp. CA-139114 TaxID=3239931 RepID=UPI003D959C28
MRPRPSRSAAAVLAATLTAALAATAGALAAPSPAQQAAARDAATWLTTQLEDGVLTNFGMPDIGLTIDALLALRATGVAPAVADHVADQVAANAAAFSFYEIDGDGDGDGDLDRIVDAGSTAKLLLAAEAAGRDPKHFGGLDLDAQTRALIATSGPHQGRVRDTTPEVYGGDASNTFDQSLAILGLTRSGGAPADTITYLIRQQCPAGGFRLNPDPAGTACSSDDVPDVDSTAIAVQALLAAGLAPGAATAAAKGVAWLEAKQAPDGSFVNGPQQPDPNLPSVANSNSTGLAGEALAGAGATTAAGKAATWVAALQLTTGTDKGALAYSATAFAAGAIDDMTRDQWRRATAQALLALVQIPLGDIGKPGTGSPSASASPSASRSASPSPSASATVSPSPTASASSSPSASASSASPTATATTTAPGGNLPVTGDPIVRIVALAIVLLAAGIVLVVVARRRRTP